MPAVPAIVALHLMAAMLSFIPMLFHVVVVSVLTAVVVLLRDCRFVVHRAINRIQRQNCLTDTEHKNKTDYRTDSFDHKLIPPGLGLNYHGGQIVGLGRSSLYSAATFLTRALKISVLMQIEASSSEFKL